MNWAELSDIELRTEAARAVHDREWGELHELLQAYLRFGSTRKAAGSPHTVQAYLRGFDQLLDWLDEHGRGLNLTVREAEQFVDDLLTRERLSGRKRPGEPSRLSLSSAAQYLAGVRAAYRAFQWAGLNLGKPFDGVSIPAGRTPGIVLNPPYGDEIDQACQVIDDPRVTLLLLLCAHSGLRIGEALALREEHVRGGRLQILGKGGRRRTVPTSQRVRALLDVVPPLEDGRYFDWAYHQATYRLQQAFRRSGSGHLWRGFHAARKASATRLYRAVGDYTRVSLFLGHQSVDTTRRYVAAPEDDVSEAIDLF